MAKGRKKDGTDQDQGSSFLPGLFLGLAAGTTLGLLLAPRRGDQTMALLLEKGEEFRERAMEFLDEAGDIARIANLRARGYPR